MPDLTEPEFPLYGGRVCLNLVATLGKRHDEPVERIPDAQALSRWLVAAGVLPSEMVTTVPAAQAERFRVLREAVNRLVRASMSGDTLPPGDVEVLNQAAAHPDLAAQLVGRSVVIAPGQRRPLDAALSTIARDAVHLLAGPRADRVKECGNPDCSLLFFDESQSGRRRWCSMDRCGNLAKIHATAYAGRVVALVNVGLVSSTIDTRDFYPKNIRILGFQIAALAAHGYDRRPDLEALLRGVADGRFVVPIDSVHALADAGKAHQHVEDRANQGKVMLKMGGWAMTGHAR